jgi:hypothetical protein
MGRGVDDLEPRPAFLSALFGIPNRLTGAVRGGFFLLQTADDRAIDGELACRAHGIQAFKRSIQQTLQV